MTATTEQEYAADPQLERCERVSRFIEANPGASTEQVCDAVPGIRGLTIRALGLLERSGFVRRDGGQLYSAKPYRAPR